MKKLLLSALAVCGVMSVQAAQFQYTVALDGPSEPTTSLGIGSGTVNYDDVAHTLELQVIFSGLTGNTTISHIHTTLSPFTGTGGVATTTPTFAGFPAGVTGGTYSNTLDLTAASSYNPAFVTANGGTTAGAESALATAIAEGRSYWNIHSTFAGGGEIRGFLVPVPEPSALALFGLGAGAIAWRLRRKV